MREERRMEEGIRRGKSRRKRRDRRRRRGEDEGKVVQIGRLVKEKIRKIRQN